MDWKQQLSDVLARHDAKRRAEAERLEAEQAAAHNFVNNVVVSALDTVREELMQHGRKATLEVEDLHVTLHVLDDNDEEEFSYGIEVHEGYVVPVTQRTNVKTGQTYVGKSYIYGDGNKDRIGTLQGDDIIRDFLEEYARYLR